MTLFILDYGIAFIFEPFRASNRFVLSLAEWEQLDKTTLDTYTTIVILAELDWEGKMLSEDFGFAIGLELRRKYKYLLPIIITSSLFQSFFELRAAKELRYNLLFARGTAFLPLREVSEQLDTLLASQKPISLPLLTDMNEMLFNLRGVLTDTLGHRLRPDIDKQAFHTLMQDMKALLNAEQAEALQWTRQEQVLENALDNEAVFYTHKAELLQSINTAVPSNQTKTEIAVSDRRHTLLLVEDDPRFAKEVQTRLTDYFREIIWTNDAAEAIQILANDTANHITGLLCDWRLYKADAKKYWQLQGYEVLAYAAQNRYTALFGITSLSDTNVHSIRNMLSFEVHLFKKEHFGNAPAQWQIMADVLLQKCDTVVQLLASEPSGAAWAKLKGGYIAKRNADWPIFEAEISHEAYRVFNFYKAAIEKDDARNVFGISEMSLILKGNLKNILVVRRVFMGIYFLLSRQNIYLQEIHPPSLLGDGDTGQRHHAVDAYSILRKDWWDDIEAGTESVRLSEEWDKYDQRIKNFRNTLCIDISELPRKGVLPEEKAWMHQNGIDFSFLFNYWADEEL